MILLKLGASLVTFIGATVAVFGETFRNGRLTRTGGISLIIIVIGFILSIFIDIEANIEKETDIRWEFHKDKLIDDVRIRLRLLKPMQLKDFKDFLEKWELHFRSFYPTSDYEKQMSNLILGSPREIFDPFDLQTSIALIVLNENNERIFHGKPSRLYHSEIDSKGRLLSWQCCGSQKWDSLNLEVSGIDVEIPFQYLKLHDQVNTFDKFAKYTYFSMNIPDTINWVDVYSFEIWFSVLSMDLIKLFELERERVPEDAVMVKPFIQLEGTRIVDAFKESFESEVKRRSFFRKLYRYFD